jgi:hypothetical protein
VMAQDFRSVLNRRRHRMIDRIQRRPIYDRCRPADRDVATGTWDSKKDPAGGIPRAGSVGYFK